MIGPEKSLGRLGIVAGLGCWRDVEGAWRSWPEPSDGAERTFNCCDGGMEGLAGSVQLEQISDLDFAQRAVFSPKTVRRHNATRIEISAWPFCH